MLFTKKIVDNMDKKGQITIPIEIRKKLGIKEGSKVLFLEEAGRIYLANSSMEALREAQAVFAGEAERLGLETEEDVMPRHSKIVYINYENGRKQYGTENKCDADFGAKKDKLPVL